jgi:hypothetical protein
LEEELNDNRRIATDFADGSSGPAGRRKSVKPQPVFEPARLPRLHPLPLSRVKKSGKKISENVLQKGCRKMYRHSKNAINPK